jgi:glycosyltransferase involved in cell wall biosynthesis
MACGRAVVVSSLPSATEWVVQESSGLVVPPRDVEALAGAMGRFAADPDLRRRCGAGALATARRFAGFDQNMEFVDKIYRRLVTGAGDWPEEVGLPVLATEAGEPAR